LIGYATNRANRYFRDDSLAQDAADYAMAVVIKGMGKQWAEGELDIQRAKEVIGDSIAVYSRLHRLRSSNVPPEFINQGFHGRKVV